MAEETTTQHHILLIDDDNHLLVTLADCLRYEGYEVTAAANGPEGLQCLENITPDLILLDVMMPGMDGGEVAEKIRANFRLAHVPIIYLSAAFSKTDEHRYGGVLAGEPFIAKPVEIDTLLERVRDALDSDSSECVTRGS